jgi:hypothetical protein
MWREEPPESAHAYRVECSRCGGRFEKWGTEAELQALKAIRADVEVIPYVPPEEWPTLDAFLEY